MTCSHYSLTWCRFRGSTLTQLSTGIVYHTDAFWIARKSSKGRLALTVYESVVHAWLRSQVWNSGSDWSSTALSDAAKDCKMKAFKLQSRTNYIQKYPAASCSQPYIDPHVHKYPLLDQGIARECNKIRSNREIKGPDNPTCQLRPISSTRKANTGRAVCDRVVRERFLRERDVGETACLRDG